jgi:hypothetical protein
MMKNDPVLLGDKRERESYRVSHRKRINARIIKLKSASSFLIPFLFLIVRGMTIKMGVARLHRIKAREMHFSAYSVILIYSQVSLGADNYS